MLSGYYVFFTPSLLFKLPPQIWRMFTSFLLTGSGISFIFDLYFMYHYSSSLEIASPRFTQPEDFFTYLVFVASVILLTSGFFLGNTIFTSALILAMIWTYAQDNRGRRATFIIIPMPVEYLPFAMLTFTAVFAGWDVALGESMGIVAAHSHDFITRIYPTFGGGRNWLTTPGFVRRYFRKITPNPTRRPYGTAFRQPAAQPESTSTSSGSSWTSAFQRQNNDPWSGRGAGRRLGGD